MALSFLFRGHADLCIKMATETKNIEMRDQWIALAKQWQQKAQAEELLTEIGSNSQPPPSPSLSPELDNTSGHEPPSLVTPAPALVPLEVPPLRNAEKLSPAAQVPLDIAGDPDELDDFWKQAINDIRTQRPR